MSAPKPGFCPSRAVDPHFEPMRGYRDWLKICNLGLSNATHGKYETWVTLANDPGGSTGRQYHNYEFQIKYVIKGWVKMCYGSEGEFVLEADNFIDHPPQRIHDFMEYSNDIKIFELASSADHSAIDV